MSSEDENPFTSEEQRYDILDEIFSRNQNVARDVQDEYDQAQQFFLSQEQEQRDVQQPCDLSTPINLVRRDRNKNRSDTTSPSDSTATGGTGTQDRTETTEMANTEARMTTTPSKKKKKKKKSKTANLPEAGTALPDDYQEKYTEDIVEDPYEQSRPLARRVEYAIWKYRKNHKFSQENKAIFDHYLKFGGVDTSPNAFLGRTTSADTPDDPDAEADFEAAKTATDAIDLNDSEDGDEGYVSFSEVVQVYLGKVFVYSARFITLQDFLAAPDLIDSFLRYLQIRNVCPEFSDDLIKARLLTAQAKEELPRCKRVSNLLPGDFNMALGILFGGEVESGMATCGEEPVSKSENEAIKGKEEDVVFPEFQAWASSDSKMMALMNSFLDDVVGMKPVDARRIAGSMIPDISAEKVVNSQDKMLVKIKHIVAPPLGKDTDSSNASANGVELMKVTVAEYDEDLEKTNDDVVFDLYFEQDIANEFLVGMVFVASMRQLTSGLWYLVRGYLVCPSLYKKDEYAEYDDQY